MSTALVWILIGLFLIISELLATSIIAVFIGLGAIATGLALQFGLIESVAAQYMVFAVVSALSLILARGKLKRWFVGYTLDRDEHQTQFQKDVGERVVVHSDFVNGKGRVMLNGVQWNALSDEPLKEGDVAWVVRNQGIELEVSAQRPAS